MLLCVYKTFSKFIAVINSDLEIHISKERTSQINWHLVFTILFVLQLTYAQATCWSIYVFLYLSNALFIPSKKKYYLFVFYTRRSNNRTKKGSGKWAGLGWKWCKKVWTKPCDTKQTHMTNYAATVKLKSSWKYHIKSSLFCFGL